MSASMVSDARSLYLDLCLWRMFNIPHFDHFPCNHSSTSARLSIYGPATTPRGGDQPKEIAPILHLSSQRASSLLANALHSAQYDIIVHCASQPDTVRSS